MPAAAATLAESIRAVSWPLSPMRSAMTMVRDPRSRLYGPGQSFFDQSWKARRPASLYRNLTARQVNT